MLDYCFCQCTGDEFVGMCVNGLSRKVLCVSCVKSMVSVETERQQLKWEELKNGNKGAWL